MRCLILGASGLLGTQLANQCEQRRLPWLGTAYNHPDSFHIPLDLRDTENLLEVLQDYQPEVTFLAADAPTSSVLALAQVSRELRSRLVSFSPESVFGECRFACKEAEPTPGSSTLARRKIEQEELLKELLPEQHLIVRTSCLFGPELQKCKQIANWLKSWEMGSTITVAEDRYFQPTFAPDLAKNVLQLCQVGFVGTIHLVGPERHTEFSFARLASHLLGYDMDLVEGCPAAELLPDDQPLQPWLDRQLMRLTVGPKAIRSTADGLRQVKQAVPQRLTRAA
jgi:dTDP-4-dehydrorhamnose reductase